MACITSLVLRILGHGRSSHFVVFDVLRTHYGLNEGMVHRVLLEVVERRSLLAPHVLFHLSLVARLAVVRGYNNVYVVPEVLEVVRVRFLVQGMTLVAANRDLAQLLRDRGAGYPPFQFGFLKRLLGRYHRVAAAQPVTHHSAVKAFVAVDAGLRF